jgi:hypothetical protein
LSGWTGNIPAFAKPEVTVESIKVFRIAWFTIPGKS